MQDLVEDGPAVFAWLRKRPLDKDLGLGCLVLYNMIYGLLGQASFSEDDLVHLEELCTKYVIHTNTIESLFPNVLYLLFLLAD
jgi:hypothetical protein